MITYITVDEALKVHERLIEQHGGMQGIRDLGLLTSAIEMPKSAFGGEDLYLTVFDKAAAYLFHIAKNHPFIDGNKRTAAFVSLLFLRINGVRLLLDQAQYELLVIGVAEGLVTKTQLASYYKSIATPSKKMSKKSQRRAKRG